MYEDRLRALAADVQQLSDDIVRLMGRMGSVDQDNPLLRHVLFLDTMHRMLVESAYLYRALLDQAGEGENEL